MEIKDIKVRADLPYPEIKEATSDMRTVSILKDLLSNRNGELTAILQYTYQSRLAGQTEKEIAEVLEEISVVEMKHTKLLMNAILSFGGDPRYDNSFGQYFSASYVNYAQKLKDMLQANIRGESKAIEDYSRAIKNMQNQSLKDLLNRIILDEQIHLEIFEKLLSSVKFLTI